MDVIVFGQGPGVTAVAAPVNATSPPRRKPRAVPITVFFAGSAVFWLALWWLAAAMEAVPSLFLPSPAAVASRLVMTIQSGFADATLAEHVAASLLRVGAALLAALAIAVPVGVGMALSPVLRGVFDPIIEAYRPIPPLAYLPLVVIWFGIGEFSKVLLIFLAIVPAVALSTASGIRSVPVERINAARTLGASRVQLLREVFLPNAFPEILVGARIGLSVGWSTLVAAELVAATRGLGFMIQTASNFLVTDIVIVGIVTIAAIAFAVEFGMRWLEKRLTPWKGKF